METNIQGNQLLALPDGWLAPRKEIIVRGFDRYHVYGFSATMANVTDGKGTSQKPYAKCCICQSIIEPDAETIREHAMLHLSVELATVLA